MASRSPFFSGMLPLLALASCGAPAPAPVPLPPPPMAAPAPAPRPSADWREWPVNPGDWRYRQSKGGSLSEYGPAHGEPLLAIRCDLASKHITLRFTLANPASAATVHTSFGTTAWLLQTVDFSAATPRASVELPATDNVFDRIAGSRGRFALAFDGQAPLVVPNWAEVSRVIEDCR